MPYQQSQRAIDNRPLTPIETQKRFHAYQEATQPFVKLHVNLMATQIKKMVFHPNGQVEIQYTDEYYTLKEQIDETLELLQKDILFDIDFYGIKSPT